MDQAHHALIDPLIEPDPSDETGLNAHFRSTFAPQQPITPPGSGGSPKKAPTVTVRPQNTGSSVETNPYRRSRASSESQGPSSKAYGQSSPSSRKYDYPTPPTSASPRRERFSDNHRAEAFSSLNDSRPRRSSNPAPPPSGSKGLTRGGSLRERYPGDKSHRPLELLRKDEKVAYRAPHLRKKNFQGADVIDRLDKAAVSQYHHEGPYDAASFARNKYAKYSPVAAVQDSNEEALRATPRENIINSVQKHRPLEGTAEIPPGMPDKFGRILYYEEGADLQREPGGDYRRWNTGVDYHPDDLKGKGEPSYTIEKALKDHKTLGDSGTEMTTRHRARSAGHSDAPGIVPSQQYDAGEASGSSGIGRSNTTGQKLRSRFGSLRRRKQEVPA